MDKKTNKIKCGTSFLGDIDETHHEVVVSRETEEGVVKTRRDVGSITKLVRRLKEAREKTE